MSLDEVGQHRWGAQPETPRFVRLGRGGQLTTDQGVRLIFLRVQTRVGESLEQRRELLDVAVNGIPLRRLVQKIQQRILVCQRIVLVIAVLGAVALVAGLVRSVLDGTGQALRVPAGAGRVPVEIRRHASVQENLLLQHGAQLLGNCGFLAESSALWRLALRIDKILAGRHLDETLGGRRREKSFVGIVVVVVFVHLGVLKEGVFEQGRSGHTPVHHAVRIARDHVVVVEIVVVVERLGAGVRVVVRDLLIVVDLGAFVGLFLGGVLRGLPKCLEGFRPLGRVVTEGQLRNRRPHQRRARFHRVEVARVDCVLFRRIVLPVQPRKRKTCGGEQKACE